MQAQAPLLIGTADERLTLTGVLRRDWRFIAAALVACVAVRLPWILIVHAEAGSDSYFYVTSAASIAAGHGYQILGHPTAFFPIGWPAVLAALFTVTGPSYLAVEVLDLVLWMATTVLVFLLGERLGGRRAGLVAALVVALEPNMSVYVLRAASENLFIPLLLAAVLLLVWRPGRTSLWRVGVAAALVGGAILVRSTALLVPIVVGGWLLVRERRTFWPAMRAAAVFVVVAYAALVPWLVRNELVMHTFAISTNGGYTLWLGDNPKATGGNAVLENHPRWPIGSVNQEARSNVVYQRKAFDFILHDTGRWLALIPAKFTYLFGWDLGPFRNITEHQPDPDPRAGPIPRRLDRLEAVVTHAIWHHSLPVKISYYAYWILGGIALALATIRRRLGASLALTLVLLWIVFHVTVAHGQFRYMLAVTPLVAPALGWTLVTAAVYVSARIRVLRSGQSASSV